MRDYPFSPSVQIVLIDRQHRLPHGPARRSEDELLELDIATHWQSPIAAGQDVRSLGDVFKLGTSIRFNRNGGSSFTPGWRSRDHVVFS